MLELPCLGVPDPNTFIIRLELADSIQTFTYLCSEIVPDWIPGDSLNEALMSIYAVYTFYLVSPRIQVIDASLPPEAPSHIHILLSSPTEANIASSLDQATSMISVDQHRISSRLLMLT